MLDGEVNASLFNRDRQGPSVEGNSDASSLGSLFGRQNVRDQSAVDWAGSLRGSWAAGANRTRFAAGVRFVGPGYASVGVRALRTDLLSYDGAWDQSVLHDRLGLGARMSREETGVVLPDRGNAFVTRADARADWHPARGPGLQLGYTFNRQDQHASGAASELRNDVNIVDARLRETRSLRSARLSTFFSFHLHHGTSTDETARNDARAFQLAELITFPSRLSLFVRAAHTHTTTGVSDDSDPRVVNLDATLTCDFPRGLANDVGTSYTSGVHTRGRGVFVGTRLGLAGGKGAFEVRWEYDDFKDLAAPPNDRIEQIARASLTLNP